MAPFYVHSRFLTICTLSNNIVFLFLIIIKAILMLQFASHIVEKAVSLGGKAFKHAVVAAFVERYGLYKATLASSFLVHLFSSPRFLFL